MSETIKEGVKKARPEFRNINALIDLPQYRMPMAAYVSILHRISGFLLFLALPWILYLFDQSLSLESSFEYFLALMSGKFAKVVVLLLFWSYIQHFCSGIRHLIMDNHIGLDKDSARMSAVAVLIVSGLITLLVAIKLFGA